MKESQRAFPVCLSIEFFTEKSNECEIERILIINPNKIYRGTICDGTCEK